MGYFKNKKEDKKRGKHNPATPVKDALNTVGEKIDPRKLKDLPNNVVSRLKNGKCANCGKSLVNGNKKDVAACSRPACIREMKENVNRLISIEELKKQRAAHHSCGCNKHNIYHNCDNLNGERIN